MLAEAASISPSPHSDLRQKRLEHRNVHVQAVLSREFALLRRIFARPSLCRRIGIPTNSRNKGADVRPKRQVMFAAPLIEVRPRRTGLHRAGFSFASILEPRRMEQSKSDGGVLRALRGEFAAIISGVQLGEFELAELARARGRNRSPRRRRRPARTETRDRDPSRDRMPPKLARHVLAWRRIRLAKKCVAAFTLCATQASLDSGRRASRRSDSARSRIAPSSPRTLVPTQRP